MSETKFNTTSNTTDYNNKGIDINSVNPYIFMSHSYHGTGGFKSGSYLVPHPREGYYNTRKSMSSYRNYVKPIINSMINPIFNTTITRESSNDMYTTFLTDVDNAGTSMSTNTKEVLTLARLHGVTFIVMDNFPEIPTIRKDAIDMRRMPFIYIQPAYLVSSYSQDEFGNLTSITFTHEESRDNKTVYVDITWDDTSKTVVVRDGKKVLSTTKDFHGLGVIPVISVYATDTKEILPTPPFYDIAKTNYVIFNKDSEIRDQERSQAFSILYYQTDSNTNSMTVGPNNAIVLPAISDITITPGFVEPDPNILSMLVANNEKLVDSLYRIAESEGIIGVQKANSGIAASYSFISKRNLLDQSANIAVKYENDLAKLFSRYVSEDVDYTVNYSRKWEPTVQTDFETLTKMLELDISDEAKTEIKKLMMNDIFSHLSDDELLNLKNSL